MKAVRFFVNAIFISVILPCVANAVPTSSWQLVISNLTHTESIEASTGKTIVTLSWNAIADFSGGSYEIKQRDPDTTKYFSSTSASWTSPGQVKQGRHYFYVRACYPGLPCGSWRYTYANINTTNPIGKAYPSSPRYGSSLSSGPCFKWRASSSSNIKKYAVNVSVSSDFASQRWVKAVTSGTEACWNNGSGWTSGGLGTRLPVPSSFAKGTKYYWRVNTWKDAYMVASSTAYFWDSSSNKLSGLSKNISTEIGTGKDIVNLNWNSNNSTLPGAYYEVVHTSPDNNVLEYSNISTNYWSSEGQVKQGVHKFKVRACSSALGCGSYVSIDADVNAGNRIVPATLITPLMGQDLTNGPCFDWQASPSTGIQKYAVNVNIGGDFSDQRWVLLEAEGTSACWKGGEGWISSGLGTNLPLPTEFEAGVEYSWRVNAWNDVFYVASQTGTFWNTSYLNVESLSSSTTSDELTGQTLIHLNWESISELSADGYYNIHYVQPDGNILTEQVTTNSWSSERQAKQGQHVFTVMACSGSDCGAAANITVDVNMEFPIVPAIPIYPANNAHITIGEKGPCFAWEASSSEDVVKYAINVNIGGDFSAQRWVKQVDIGTKACWDGGEGWTTNGLTTILPVPEQFEANTNYSWRVNAWNNSFYEKSATRRFSVTPTNTPAPTISNLSAGYSIEAITNKLIVNLDWQDASDLLADGWYEVKHTDLDAIDIPKNYDVNTNSWTSPGQVKQGSHNFLVKECSLTLGCGLSLSVDVSINEAPDEIISPASLTSPISNQQVIAGSNGVCFNWDAPTNMDNVDHFAINVNVGGDFSARRWVVTHIDKNATQVCWNYGENWTTNGLVEQIPVPTIMNENIEYSWRINTWNEVFFVPSNTEKFTLVYTQLYQNSDNELFFQLPTAQGGGIIKLVFVGGEWMVTEITDINWSELTVSSQTLEFGDFTNNGVTDFSMTSADGSQSITFTLGDSGYNPVPSNKIIFIHTDLLSAPVAETNSNGVF